MNKKSLTILPLLLMLCACANQYEPESGYYYETDECFRTMGLSKLGNETVNLEVVYAFALPPVSSIDWEPTYIIGSDSVYFESTYVTKEDVELIYRILKMEDSIDSLDDKRHYDSYTGLYSYNSYREPNGYEDRNLNIDDYDLSGSNIAAIGFRAECSVYAANYSDISKKDGSSMSGMFTVYIPNERPDIVLFNV